MTMPWVAFDTETALIEVGNQVPPMTCLTYAQADGGQGILDHKEGLEWFKGALGAAFEEQIYLLGHNTPFDIMTNLRESGWDQDLIDKTFDTYDKGRIGDTMLLCKLDDIQEGYSYPQYSLGMLAKRYFGTVMDKSTWRLRYGELRGTPIEEWEQGARDYAIGDAEETLKIAKHIGTPTNWQDQCKYYYGMAWISARGMKTDLPYVAKLEQQFIQEMTDAREALVAGGLLKKAEQYISIDRKGLVKEVEKWCTLSGIERPQTKNGTTSAAKTFFEREELSEKLDLYRRYKGIIKKRKKRSKAKGRTKWTEVGDAELLGDNEVAYLLREGLLKMNPEKFTRDSKEVQNQVDTFFVREGRPVPRTKKGAVATTKDVIKEIGDPTLSLISDYMHSQKMLKTYVKPLKEGLVHTSFNPIVATGRTSSRAPNLQNIPQSDGIREAFIPREGFVYAAVDYDTLELRTLAQTCLDLFGHSAMADALRTGQDLHTLMAAKVSGYDYSDPRIKQKIPGQKKTFRDFAKIINFGLPGGMGAETFQGHAAKAGIEISIAKAQEIIQQYKEQWPEMEKYFRYISDLLDHQTYIDLPASGRRRGGIGYCDGCNNGFQGLASDGAKEALWEIVKACFHSKGEMRGVYPVNFIHDEFLCEVPIAEAHERAYQIAEIMCSAMQKWVPDIPITAEPALMLRWSKDAKPVFNKEGKLIPWEPTQK